MLLRFLKWWRGHEIGTTAVIPGGVADQLIRHGYAERVSGKQIAKQKLLTRPIQTDMELRR